MTSSSASIMTALTATLGEEVVSKILSSKILLVGSGGIGYGNLICSCFVDYSFCLVYGYSSLLCFCLSLAHFPHDNSCELIKDLVLMGFRHCQLIDLDTIDVSNLNRQLLFRSKHVGKPKCEMASQVALEMISETEKSKTDLQPVTYQAHHGNVCDNNKFNVHFVKQFDLVLNALDNVAARRRVNRLCLAAAVPLVEAGTTGYLGQVNVMDKASGVACYECTTQETQKVYPICTIRSTPSEPVHTIVWSKELYKLLFAEKMEESMLYEDSNGEEPSTYMQAVIDYRALLKDISKGKEDVCKAAQALVQTLYVDEIQKQLDMGRYKAAKKTPAPLEENVISSGTVAANTDTPPSKSKATDEVWTPTECTTEFTACLLEAHADPGALLPAFDKDDDLAMRFVTATSNLRSLLFQISPLQSLYSAKGIAGNIIPAIATTNAIVAGLQIIQVINILKAQLKSGEKGGTLVESCQYINCVRQKTRNGLYLTASKLNAPNPKCFVCRQATIPLTINVNNWTLETFLTRIVKKELGFEEPTVMLDGDIIWEEGQDADSEAFKTNLPKLLSKLPCGGIQHGTVVTIEDFSQDLQVDVAVEYQELWEGEEYDNPEQQFIIGGDKPKAAAAAATEKPAAKEAASTKLSTDAAAEDSDSDIEAWDVGADSKPKAAKRHVDDDSKQNGNAGPQKKRARATPPNGDGTDKEAEAVDVEVIEID
jgi:ubiquitin-like 1-activating enzyme E1 B